jgi:hypothetical protein
MRKRTIRDGVLLACSLLSVAALGCGNSDYPELVEVQGTVTLGGKPLAKATVEFRPLDETVRGGVGTTDAQGRYELTYVRDLKGAPLGNYKVIISTASDPETGNETKERVPARYNSRTELAAEVKEGKESYDFTLQSR